MQFHLNAGVRLHIPRITKDISFLPHPTLYHIGRPPTDCRIRTLQGFTVPECHIKIVGFPHHAECTMRELKLKERVHFPGISSIFRVRGYPKIQE